MLAVECSRSPLRFNPSRFSPFPSPPLEVECRTLKVERSHTRAAPLEVASVPQEVTGQPRRVVVGGVTWRDTFSALKHRNFKLFFVGQLVSLTGTWMQST